MMHIEGNKQLLVDNNYDKLKSVKDLTFKVMDSLINRESFPLERPKTATELEIYTETLNNVIYSIFRDKLGV